MRFSTANRVFKVPYPSWTAPSSSSVCTYQQLCDYFHVCVPCAVFLSANQKWADPCDNLRALFVLLR